MQKEMSLVTLQGGYTIGNIPALLHKTLRHLEGFDECKHRERPEAKQESED